MKPAHLTACLALALCTSPALAAPIASDHGGNPMVTDDANAIALRIAERPANEGRVGAMHFVLRNAAGRERKRSALLVHSQLDDATRIAIFFDRPASIRGTAFLSHDYVERTDQNWLFIPATDRVRRLPSSDGRDAFMGTDLSYGDIKNDFKFPLDEWRFTHVATRERDGREVVELAGEALTDEIVRDTGYSRFEAVVDPDTWFPIEITYADADGEPLKTMRILEQAQVGEAWTAMQFVVENLQTGHTTQVVLDNMQYAPDLDLELLAPEALPDGSHALEFTLAVDPT